MLLLLLSLLPSLAFAQKSQQLPISSLDQKGAQQAIQQELDRKYSIFGGTVSGPVLATKSIYLIQGSSIVWSDGSVSTSNAGGAINSGNYVQKQGDTMSGGLTINTPSGTRPQTLYQASPFSNTPTIIQYQAGASESTVGYGGVYSSTGEFVQQGVNGLALTGGPSGVGNLGIYISSKGNVGISTTSSSFSLSVGGSAVIEGPTPWIDVRYFGVKCDGVTDDGAAISLATAAIPSTGGTLLFPPGTCVTNSSNPLLSIDSSNKNIYIRGAGMTATILSQNGSGDVIDFTLTDAGRQQGEHISDMEVTCNGGAGKGIYALNWNDGVIERVFVKQCQGHGIDIEGVNNYHNVIKDCRITSANSSGAIPNSGIMIGAGNENQVQNTYLNIGNYATEWSTAVNVAGCGNCRDLFNIYDGIYTGIFTNGNFISVGSQFDMTGSTNGIVIGANNPVTIIDPQVSHENINNFIQSSAVSSKYLTLLNIGSIKAYSEIGNLFISSSTNSNIGIGTSGPQQTLDIFSSVNGQGNVNLIDGADIGWGGSNQTDYVAGNSSSHFVKIRTNSTDRLYVDVNGRVGIQTNSPLYALHVSGDEYATGQGIFGGTVTVQGNNFSVGGSTNTNGPLVATGTGTFVYGVKSGVAGPAGYLGEQISVSLASNQTPAPSGSVVAVSTITLSAGNWALYGGIAFTNGGTTETQLESCISTSNVAFDATDAGSCTEDTSTIGNGLEEMRTVGPRFVSITTSTTYYLGAALTYSVIGTGHYQGTDTVLRAVRIQ